MDTRPPSSDGTLFVSTAQRLRTFSLVCSLALACATAALGAETEPTYYIYHGQPKQLALDTEHVAVHVRTVSTDQFPAGLTSRGFAPADVESRPLDDWMVLRDSTLGNAARANSVPGGTNSARTAAATVHERIRAVAASGDAAVDFVSPVFRDNAGNPLLVTSRLLVGFDKNVSAATRSQLRASIAGGADVEPAMFPQPDHVRWQMRTNDGFAVLAAANALARTPGVIYAEPDFIQTAHHDFVPSDPSFSQSWALQNTGQQGGTAGFDLDATRAWDITLGSPNVIVVVFDSGVQQDHPDLNLIPGRDFTTDAASNPNGGPVGTNDNHGTWVAGCISEKISNGVGTTGLAPGVKVASARIGTNYLSTGTFTSQDSWLIDALNWAQSIGAKVTNNSNSFGEASGAIDAAYSSTHAAGLVHFASAGNDAADHIDYPASSPDVNSVAALNRYGYDATFSNYGQGLDFAAPGEQILTTDRTGKTSLGGDYATVSGTSFSSPFAAAVAALIFSVHPDWSADQVEQQMRSTAFDIGQPGYDAGFGYGLLDAYKAVSANGGATPTPTPTATPTPSYTPTPTSTPVQTPTPTPTATPVSTPTPTVTPTPTPTASPTPTPSGTPVPPPTITVIASPASVLEGATAQFMINASTVNPVQPIVVSFSITGRAVAGLDYTVDGSPSQVTIPPGASSAAVTIHALTDTLRERSEKITLTLFQGSNYNLSRTRSQRKASMTIINQGGTGRR